MSRLLNLLGDAAPPNIKGESPDEVAWLVHAFRAKRAIDGTALHTGPIRRSGEGAARSPKGSS